MTRAKVYGKPRLRRTDAPHFHCTGCHYGLIAKVLCEVMEEMDIDGKAIAVYGGGCATGRMGEFDIDGVAGPHGPAIAQAVAIKRIRPEAVVWTNPGDGELGAIGIGYFVSALLRGDRITVFFLNNAGYGGTGGQMAPTTLLGMRTSTTPLGRDARLTGFPLHAAELAATMKGVAYSARVSVHTPVNFQRAKRVVRTAFQKQIDGIGLAFVEFVSACPTNWGLSPAECLKFVEERMIVEYPLGEFKNVDSIDYSAGQSGR